MEHCTCLFSLVFPKHFNYFYVHTIVGELCQIKETLQKQRIAYDQVLKTRMGTFPGEFKSDVVSSEFEMLEVLIFPCNLFLRNTFWGKVSEVCYQFSKHYH